MPTELFDLATLQQLSAEIAHTDGTLSADDALNALTQCITVADEGEIFQNSHTNNDHSTRVVSALVQMAVNRRECVTERRPQVLECDVWRFQNKKEKWVAFVGLLNGRPYEIFTGLQDDDEGILLPKSVQSGWIIKNPLPDGGSRYDFSFQNSRGYKITVEGLSGKFNKEFWNYAKLISGVLRYQMPLDNVIRLINSLQLDESISTWTTGVVRALKKYSTALTEENKTDTEGQQSEN